MSFYVITPNLIATGNIVPSSFVTLDATANESFKQAGVGDKILGISWEGTVPSANPIYPATTLYAATSGGTCRIYGAGEECLLLADSTGWTAADFVKPGTAGVGVKANTGDLVGAWAIENTAAGDWGRVIVMDPFSLSNGASNNAVTYTTNTTLTTTDSGKLIIAGGADIILTLPAGSATTGLSYTVAVNSTGAGGSVGVLLDVPTGTAMHGNGFTAASGKGALNTHATARDGDSIMVRSNGTDYWIINAPGGTWAREA